MGGSGISNDQLARQGAAWLVDNKAMADSCCAHLAKSILRQLVEKSSQQLFSGHFAKL